MNLNDPRHAWSRLAASARQVRDDRDTSAPYGFATRVAALAFAEERTVASLFERFALRAVGVSCLLAIASVAGNYSVLTDSGMIAAVGIEEVEIAPGDDTVAVVLDLTD